MTIRRRSTLTLGASLALGVGAPSGAGSTPARKLLRIAFPVAETTFDPAQVSDLYSNTVIAGILEAPLEYEYLANPARVRPATATAMPEVSADSRTFTFRIRPGIHFADDPAFQGRPRELVAEDFVYAIKRHYDPRWKSPKLQPFDNEKILGLMELRRKAIETRQPFDYDAPAEGLRTLDRYTFQCRLAEPSPRFLRYFALAAYTGAIAREVVEAYGDRVGEHPVGTGPFRLAAWKRSSRIVLERNPGYREVRYDEHPPEGDAHLQRVALAMKGRRLPMVDEIRIAIIEESQPLWLAFLNGELDLTGLPAPFMTLAFPNNRLAPYLVRRGVQAVRWPNPDVSMTYFAMDHPVVGGYQPHRVALRRAVSLALDIDREVRLLRHGQAIPAQGTIGPGTFGYDPRFKSTMSEYDPARAQALLDLHGYVDRDGDGFREQPDGRPLVLRMACEPDRESRQYNEVRRNNLNAVGLRIEFDPAPWPENLKASRAGKLMMWNHGWTAGSPDGDVFLSLAYGPNRGNLNRSRFALPAFDALYERQRSMPDGPERLAVMQEATRLMVAYMPIKAHVHRFGVGLAHPWVTGYHRQAFSGLYWQYVDIDTELLQRRGVSAAD